MQSCSNCGYESPGSARFCRQCGATLVIETELSAATTRNYGAQTPASATLPPSVSDAIAGETERYYKAPPVASIPAPTTAPIQAKLRPWQWVLLLIVLLIGAALGAGLRAHLHPGDATDPIDGDAPPASLADQARRERREELVREREQRLREIQERMKEALERQNEALEHAREAAQQASQAGNAFSSTSEKLLDLSPYEYPKATVGTSIRIPGYEMLRQRTSDSFDAVQEFYQSKLGKPVIAIHEEWEKRLVFISSITPGTPSQPPIAVVVQPDDEHPDQLKIEVLRSPFRLTKAEE